jgi:hypothetical protein
LTKVALHLLAGALLAASGAQAQEPARRPCDGLQGMELRTCWRREMCAQTSDPAACEARAEERRSRYLREQEPCRDLQGDAFTACLREQRRKK